MDKPLKLLIAAACLIVIAAGGLYVWKEYPREPVALTPPSASQQVCNAATEISGALNCNNPDAMRFWCKNFSDRYPTRDNERWPAWNYIVEQCREARYLD